MKTIPFMQKTTLIGTILSLTAVGITYGNGGGYTSGGVRATGGISGFEPVATEHVRILDEKLTIRAGRMDAKVEVRYLMRNMSDEPVTVRFGFPIEETTGVNLLDMVVAPKAHTKLQYCKNYAITARGNALDVSWQAETNPGGDDRFIGLSGWNISEITFAKGEEVPVTIRFESEYPGDHRFVSFTESTSASLFRYRLSTAACWHGTIGEGQIVIEPDGIDPGDLRVIKPVNRFKKEGEKWVWNFKDLEPTMVDDMEIECQPEMKVFGHQPLVKPGNETLPAHLLGDYIDRGGRWSMLHSNYEVMASSTLAQKGKIRYDATNLRNAWEENVWSEGAAGNGVGEWLEISPVAAKALTEIHIKPGYQTAEDPGKDQFKAHARPKKIRIELNGEHTFDAELADRAEEQVIPVRGYNQPVKKIRMTFTEVYPGERFEDLCVTNVRLHVQLESEPKIQPQR